MENEKVKGYSLGSQIEHFGTKKMSRVITFVLTQDCNLRCGYCYMSGKNRHSKMSWSVAKDAVDFMLSQDFEEDAVVWEFIGGEPLLEVELMDQICDYIQLEMYRRSHKWYNNYAFSLSTNGVLYHTERVQKFIAKHKDHLSIGITIDGIREKHDMHRVFPNGQGSYDIVAKNVKLWLEQFPGQMTKVTFASQDLPYLKDSIIHLWELGIQTVPANVVFENVWKDGDDAVLEQQLKELADYAIEHGLWKTHNCTFFSDSIGRPLQEDHKRHNWCGSGRYMLAVDHEGKIYPCVRFMGYSLEHKPGLVLGDIYTGINPDRLRPFYNLNLVSQSTDECINCEVASGCAWCQGFNYDSSDSDTMFQRATYICRMHKARVRANNYYFARLARLKGEKIQNPYSRHLFLITADDAVPICSYERQLPADIRRMPEETFARGLRFAAEHSFFPVILQPAHGPLFQLPDGELGWNAIPAERAEEMSGDVIVYDHEVSAVVPNDLALVRVDRCNLPKLAEMVQRVVQVSHRTVIHMCGTHDFTAEDFDMYEQQMALIRKYVQAELAKGRNVEVNTLTDSLWLSGHDDCGAGVKNFAVAPDGRIYICPAFYYNDPESAVGSLDEGIDMRKVAMCDFRRAPVCNECRAYHCKRCVFDNYRFTGELNTPPRSQCVTSHLELRQSAALREALPNVAWTSGPFEVTQLDPLETQAHSSKLVRR